jgi:C-terminal processing protease CtpA/Prc
MQTLEGTDAMIVDLRECHGGDPAMVVLSASWFFDGPPRHWNDMVRRLDGTTRQFWTAAWLPGARYVDKPVYVLTAQQTFSAPESFAYELQQTRRATIVGETTGGGAHPVRGERLDDRFMIGVPFARAINPITRTNWEGTGVAPDVKVPAADALETALRLIRETPRP